MTLQRFDNNPKGENMLPKDAKEKDMLPKDAKEKDMLPKDAKEKDMLSTCSSYQDVKGEDMLSTCSNYKDYIIDLLTKDSKIHEDLLSAVEFHSEIEISDGGDVSTPIHEMLNWGSYKRFGQQANTRNLEAAFFMNEDGSVWQAMLSCEEGEGKGGKRYKYIAPVSEDGNGDRLFLPPVPPSIRRKIGKRYGVTVPEEGSFWEWVAKRRDIPYIITEGAKKALRGLSEGLVCVAMYGCTCGVQVYGNNWEFNHYQVKNIFKKVIPSGSIVLLALDKDESHSASIAVTRATAKLKEAFTSSRIYFQKMDWKPSQGKGLDDVSCSVMENSYLRGVKAWERQMSKTGGEFPRKKDKLHQASWYSLMLAQHYAGRLYWDSPHQRWMENLKGTHIWQPMEFDDVREMVLQALRTNTDGEFPRALADDALSLLRSETGVNRGRLNPWNERQGVLPFQDGIVDIATGVFEPHKSENLITWVLPRNYNSPDCDDWANIRNWLTEVWSPTDVDRLLAFAAATLRRRHDLQRFLYLIGMGGSGKGTYTRLLEKIVGKQNLWSGRVPCLEKDTQVGRLLGKVLAIFADQDKVTGSLQPFKMLTGGDTLCGRLLYKNPFDFKYEGMCIVTANDNTFLSAARWLERRAVVVQCNHVPKEQKDLDSLFEPEIAAFTKYLLTISNEQIDRILGVYGHTSHEYLSIARTDSVMSWLQDNVIYEPGAIASVGRDKTSAETLWGNYYQYCQDSNLMPKSLNNFGDKILEHALSMGWQDVKRHRTNAFRGIKNIRLRDFAADGVFDSDTLVSCGGNLDDTFKPLLHKHYDSVSILSLKTTLEKNAENADINLSDTGGEKLEDVPISPISPPLEQPSLLQPCHSGTEEVQSSAGNTFEDVQHVTTDVGGGDTQVNEFLGLLQNVIATADYTPVAQAISKYSANIRRQAANLLTREEKDYLYGLRRKFKARKKQRVVEGARVRIIPVTEFSTIAHVKLAEQYPDVYTVDSIAEGDKCSCVKADGAYTTWLPMDILEVVNA